MTRKNLFLYTAIAIIMGISLWQAFSPYILHKEKLGEIYRDARWLSPQEVVGKIKNSGGKKTLVYVYASWCTACYQVTPLLTQRIRSGDMQDMQVLFLSADKEPYDMARYLIEEGHEGIFTPYMIKYSLADVLAPLGAKEAAAIPYLATFDMFGKMTGESSGEISPAQISGILDRPRN